MANTIRLKQGTGSDPSASDLVLGEPAVRTDTGEIFLLKDDGSIAKVAGGIEDGDKGDLTVSNDGATFTIDNDAVTYAKIQNVSATNRILGRDSSGAGVIEEIAPSSVRTMLGLAASATTDTTNASNISSGTLAAARVATLNQDTTGSAATLTTARTIAGTSFDGSANIDISYTNLTNKLSVGDGGLTQNNFTDTLKSKLDGIAASATNVTNNNQLTNGAGYITATLTEEQVEDYVGGMVTGNTETGITVTYQDSDGTLDFVVASQTDNNFTTTLKNKLDGIAAGATNVTNNNQLTNGAGYITATLTNEQVQDIVGGMVSGNTESGITVTYQDSDGTLDFSVASQTDNNFTNSDHSKLDGIESGATADQSASEILTLLKTVDGSGSGLDADYLDGVSSGSFLRGDTADTASGDITFSGGGGAATIDGGSDIRFTNGDWTGNIGTPKIQGHASALYVCGGSNGIRFRENDTDRWHIDGSGHFVPASGGTYNLGSTGSYVNELFVEDVYCSNWLRLSSENTGLYNSATNQHWYSDSAKYWAMDNDGTNGGIIFRDSHGGTIRGYLYYTNANLIGLLDGDGNWAVRVDKDVDVSFNVNSVREATVLPDTFRIEGCFFENAQAVAADKTISDGYNAMSAGPITINSGVTVTIGSGEAWTIV